MTIRCYATDAGVSVDNIAKELGIENVSADVREIAVETLDVCEAGYFFSVYRVCTRTASSARTLIGSMDRAKQLKQAIGSTKIGAVILTHIG